MKHELVRLSQGIDLPVLEERFGALCSDRLGMPPLPIRLMAALALNLSDEMLCGRRTPMYLTGEMFFVMRCRSTARR
ncbi:hypothetical protein CK215_30285 [Mesorhizobium sp. WSM3864]|nr:hypothetical protein CK215_30285 [Mesorhizobium sp. WSM3864]